MPGPGVELIGEEEIAEVMQVLTSRSLSRYGSADDPAFGAKVRHVEQEIAALAGVKYALGLSGGGSGGLWISLLGLGVGPGDEVIVPGFTFVASISAIVYARATPVLAEVDDSFNLDPADVEARITPRTRAIIVVHMLGAPGASRRAEGRRRPSRHPDHRGLRAGVRRDLPGPGRRRDRRDRGLQLQRVQDHHLRRRRHDRHRRRGPVRAPLRDPRPGSRAEPARVEVRRATVPRHELQDDRAVGRRPAGPGPQARPDPDAPAGEQEDREVDDRGSARSRVPRRWSIRRATSPRTSS